MVITTIGKWLQVSRDWEAAGAIVLPDGAPIGCVGRIEALGPQCTGPYLGGVGDRILFMEEGLKTFTVDGAPIYVVHEDHVIGVIPTL